jgi:hypothetical protein
MFILKRIFLKKVGTPKSFGHPSVGIYGTKCAIFPGKHKTSYLFIKVQLPKRTNFILSAHRTIVCKIGFFAETRMEKSTEQNINFFFRKSTQKNYVLSNIMATKLLSIRN